MKNLTLKQMKSLVGKTTYVAKITGCYDEEPNIFFVMSKITAIGINDVNGFQICTSNDEAKAGCYELHKSLDELSFTKKEAVEKMLIKELNFNQKLVNLATKEYKVDLCKLKAK